MKIQSKKVLKTLKGSDLKNQEDQPLTLGEALGMILTNAKDGGKMKLFLLAQKFSEGKDVEIDQADLGIIKKGVESTEIYNNLVTGQILVILEDVKEKK